MLRIAEAVRVATIAASSKDGFNLYQKWKLNMSDIIKPGETGEVKTLFEKLKDKPSGSNIINTTLFDVLRSNNAAKVKKKSFMERFKKG